MAKKRQFDEAEVLEQIAQYFWEHGYVSTKVDQLSALTGLTKSSLYNAFGNKEALFIRIVDFYVEQHLVKVMSRLDVEQSIADNLKLMFTAEFLNPENPLLSYGCLVTNSIVELRSNEPRLYDYVIDKFNLGRIGMYEFFNHYVKNGKVVEGVQADELSELFMTFRQGLKVQSRIKEPQPALQKSIKAFILMMQTMEVR